MKRFKITSKLNYKTTKHFCFDGLRKYDFEPNASIVINNEADADEFSKDRNFEVEEINKKGGK